MKTEELKALGLNDEQVQRVFAMNGADVNREKQAAETAKAERDAIEKMTAWHNGTRGFNAKSASEAKLKLNYKVCKELGFDREASLIKAEADSRGIVLECDFIEWIQVIMECNNEYDNID